MKRFVAWCFSAAAPEWVHVAVVTVIGLLTMALVFIVYAALVRGYWIALLIVAVGPIWLMLELYAQKRRKEK